MNTKSVLLASASLAIFGGPLPTTHADPVAPIIVETESGTFTGLGDQHSSDLAPEPLTPQDIPQLCNERANTFN